MTSKLLLLLLAPLLGYTQSRTVIKGRVVSGNFGIKNVLLINDSAQTETRSDSLGNFTIKAVLGDLFILSDYKVSPLKIRYGQEYINNGIFIITSELVATELDEVIITQNKKISAEGLGIISKGVARYTPAERRYEAQGKVKVYIDSVNPGTYIQTDGFINRLTGKRKALKKGLETERKEGIVNNLNGLYTEDEITREYKIPKEYVNGFIFFVAEDTDIAGAIKLKNDFALKLRLNELSLIYLDFLNNEK